METNYWIIYGIVHLLVGLGIILYLILRLDSKGQGHFTKGYLSVDDLMVFVFLGTLIVIIWPFMILAIPPILTDHMKKPFIVWKKPMYKKNDILKDNYHNSSIRILKVTRNDQCEYSYNVKDVNTPEDVNGYRYSEVDLNAGWKPVPKGKMTEAIFGS